MPISVNWDTEIVATVFIQISGIWTLQELHTAIDDALQLMDSTETTVHVLVDMTDANTLPSNMLSIRGKIAKNTRDNHGITAIAGTHALIRSFMGILNRTLGEDTAHVFTLTLDEARAALVNAQDKSE